jgi:hypothetical protein
MGILRSSGNVSCELSFTTLSIRRTREDIETLLKCYSLADRSTMSAVMNEPTKLRSTAGQDGNRSGDASRVAPSLRTATLD